MPAQIQIDRDTSPAWSPESVRRVGRMMQAWREADDGVEKFAYALAGVRFSEQQRDLLAQCVRRKPGDVELGVSAVSAQGIGKTFALGWLIWYRLTLWRNALVVATAPRERQLTDLLWPEMERTWRKTPWLYRQADWTKTRIGMRGQNEEWQALARTATRPENMAGFHADNMTLIVDEASGVSDDIHETIQGTCTQPDNFIVMVSQGTRVTGEFYKSHHGRDAKLWRRCAFSALDSELITPSHIARLKIKWGEQSNRYRIRVLGQFPTLSDTGLFHPDALFAAEERVPFAVSEEEPVHWGMDVARYGDDFTTLVGRQGENIVRVDRWQGMDLMYSLGRAIATTSEYEMSASINVDEIGLGAGIVDGMLERQNEGGLKGIEINGVNVATRPDDPEQFALLRDEIWFDLSNRYRQGAIAYGPDVDAEAREAISLELEGVEYGFNKKGQRKVDDKDTMRKKLGHSPDVADALCLAFHDAGGEAMIEFL